MFESSLPALEKNITGEKKSKQGRSGVSKIKCVIQTIIMCCHFTENIQDEIPDHFRHCFNDIGDHYD